MGKFNIQGRTSDLGPHWLVNSGHKRTRRGARTIAVFIKVSYFYAFNSILILHHFALIVNDDAALHTNLLAKESNPKVFSNFSHNFEVG
jgi:hypothetical protein